MQPLSQHPWLRAARLSLSGQQASKQSKKETKPPPWLRRLHQGNCLSTPFRSPLGPREGQKQGFRSVRSEVLQWAHPSGTSLAPHHLTKAGTCGVQPWVTHQRGHERCPIRSKAKNNNKGISWYHCVFLTWLKYCWYKGQSLFPSHSEVSVHHQWGAGLSWLGRARWI